MGQRIYRLRHQPIRKNPTFEERWRGRDRGLITCWEVGRKLADKDPDLAEKAKRGELPATGWKGGVVKKLKQRTKYGVLFYLAEWQGLRGEDLDIDLTQDIELTCSKTKQQVIFTLDYDKYSNA